MSHDVNKTPLPSGPSTLCFNKESFMQEDFDVDHFLMECRRRVSLEILRDDLDVYLKVLKSAMIELINKDYADFVNLSSNLVGMDKAINKLTTPLGQLKEEVLSVQTAMDETIVTIRDKLEQKRQIKEKKACLQRLLNIVQSVEKMEKLLHIQQASEDGEDGAQSEMNGQLIERVATEFNKLQFYVNKSRGIQLVEDIKPRIANITTTLQYSLEGSFKDGLDTGNTDILRQCLRTYATIDKTKDAENLFRQYVVKPYMEEVITEEFIRTNPHNLKGMFTKVLEFIPTYCKKIKEVTTGSGKSVEVVRGYDFVVNAVWPEIVFNIEARTPSIFAPGNPELFHQRYLTSMEFVDKFERQCGSQASVKRLRSHKSYNTFMTKWSLPVYFQIRFQEVAGALESSLITPFNNVADCSTGFHLVSAQTVWSCLHQCWKDDIYLRPLCHRFWKLTLQLLSRYANWIDEVVETELSKQSNTETVTFSLTSNDGMSSTPVTSTPITTGQIVSLVVDTENIAQKLPDFFDRVVGQKLTTIGFQVSGNKTLEESIEESQTMLRKHMLKFGAYITEELTTQCSVHLKLVNDIPRLYRRTNREVPSKSSTYISSLLKPLQMFLDDHSDKLPQNLRQEWCVTVLKQLTQQYLTLTSDVLTSVKKMEDSLKRLKRVKGPSAATTSQGMSDDDKIRLQFAIDVEGFGQQIEALELKKTDIDSYNDLYELVESAKKVSATA